MIATGRSFAPVLATAGNRRRRWRLVAIGLAFAPAAAGAEPAADRPAAPHSPEVKSDAVSGTPSVEVRRMLAWIGTSGDNLELPFVIIDKAQAQVFAFSRAGVPLGSTPALMGLGRGDISPAGIGQRRLADIAPAERVTPAGRFIASLGNDLGEADILWVDYESAISLHRVIAGNRKDRRLQRLESPAADDNRISYGCINVPVEFFEQVILPLFNRTNGVVYILPEATALGAVFDLPAETPPAAAGSRVLDLNAPSP